MDKTAWLLLSQLPKIPDNIFNNEEELVFLVNTLLNKSIAKKPPHYSDGFWRCVINAQMVEVEKALEWESRANTRHIVSLDDANYPQHLKEIHDPPPVLFVEGSLSFLKHSLLSVVGARNFTEYGRYQCQQLVSQLVNCGLGVVSGLARGVDSIAHKATLKAEGYTCGVLATGVNNIYPKSNQQLAADILDAGGTLMSENQLDTAPQKHLFPKRNRIISGLSLGTLVVEASDKSGTLITARMAMEQNREVFCLPGPISSPNSVGCHKLIKQGAQLVDCVEDILQNIDLSLSVETPVVAPATDHTSQGVLQYVEFSETSLSTILTKSGLSVSKALQCLCELELERKIIRQHGNFLRLE